MQMYAQSRTASNTVSEAPLNCFYAVLTESLEQPLNCTHDEAEPASLLFKTHTHKADAAFRVAFQGNLITK